MRTSAETSFPGVWSKQTRLGGVREVWCVVGVLELPDNYLLCVVNIISQHRTLHAPKVKLSLFLLFYSLCVLLNWRKNILNAGQSSAVKCSSYNYLTFSHLRVALYFYTARYSIDPVQLSAPCTPHCCTEWHSYLSIYLSI